MTDSPSTILLRASQHCLVGRLAFEPDLKFLGTGISVCNTRLLVNQPNSRRDDGKQPDAFKLVIWREKAQRFADECRKGQLLEVWGRVHVEQYPNRNTGEQQQQIVMTVDRWEIESDPAAKPATPAPAATARPTPTTSGWESTAGGDVDDIPF